MVSKDRDWELRVCRVKLLKEAMCLTMRGCPESYRQADELFKESEKITKELREHLGDIP